MAAGALLAVLGCSSGESGPPRSDVDAWFEVTNEAVQTFYRDGVPHTDWSGRLTKTYQAASSFFPRGIYYPEPCRRATGLAWDPFTGSWDADGDGENDWDGTYQLRVSLVDVPSFAGPPGRALVHDRTYSQAEARPALLPAGEELHWEVLPNPVASYPGGPIAEGTLNLDCPTGPDGADDPNVVETLKNGGFNLALPIGRNHPQPFVNLIDRAGIDGLKIVVDAREGDGGAGFAGDLFAAPADGGQGYSLHPNVYGWQTADEPLLLAAVDGGTGACDPVALQAALDRLQQTYSAHKDATDQVIFHVEGAPRYFIENEGCDPGALWEQSVRIGDVASHDNYPSNDTPSLEDIAASMTRQTRAVDEQKPSWFTTRAYSFEEEGYPSPSRNRAAVYTAIVHGATGIWQFVWDSFMSRFAGDLRLVGVRPQIPESYGAGYGISASEELRSEGEALWSAIAALNGELATLEPALLSPTAPDGAYRVLVSDPNSQVRTMLKQAPDGGYVLIAVNMNTVPTDARFDFGRTIAEATVLFENGRSPRLQVAGLTDRLGGIDDADGSAVRVYRLRLE